jgi:hypothetical protein
MAWYPTSLVVFEKRVNMKSAHKSREIVCWIISIYQPTQIRPNPIVIGLKRGVFPSPQQSTNKNGRACSYLLFIPLTKRESDEEEKVEEESRLMVFDMSIENRCNFYLWPVFWESQWNSDKMYRQGVGLHHLIYLYIVTILSLQLTYKYSSWYLLNRMTK